MTTILRGVEKLNTLKKIAQKMKFSIKDLFNKCDQIRRDLRIWSHLPKKSLMKNFIFSAQCCLVVPHIFIQ